MNTTPAKRNVEKTESWMPTRNIVTTVTGISARVTSRVPTVRRRGRQGGAGPGGGGAQGFGPGAEGVVHAFAADDERRLARTERHPDEGVHVSDQANRRPVRGRADDGADQS